jgi:hypothetical protein
MSLPTWAADAVAKLSDHENLVLMEGTIRSSGDDPDGKPVLAVAHFSSNSGPAGRTEMHVLALITDTNLQEQITFDNEEMRVYPFST